MDWSRKAAATSFRDGEILVGFQTGTQESDVQNDERQAGASERHRFHAGGRLLSVPSGQVQAKIDQLRRSPHVRYAEANYIIHASQVPNDTNFSRLWGMRNTGQTVNGTPGTSGADIKASNAWDITTGSQSIVVAVDDTGVDYTHPDLAANIWSMPSGKSVTEGSTTCGPGTHGFRAINDAFSCDPMDDQDHGTHVSGTIGAVGNNSQGVSGVNWSTSIMGLKFLDSSGSGSTADAITTMDYAIKAVQAGVNIRVMNASWGGVPNLQALKDEINLLGSNGILFVAAAGNSGAPAGSSDYPAEYGTANEISVAASDQNDNLASFSTYGSTVDLAAPGVNVYSTIRGNNYAYYDGTSMAAPHVSGAAALILAATPSLSVTALKAALVTNVDAVPGLSGKVRTGGRLNVCRAIPGCSSAPPPPPPPPPAGCGVVSNCSFDTGLTPWISGGVKPPVLSTATVHSGTQSALLGGASSPEPNGDSSLSQTVTVPTGSPTLTFYYWPGQTLPTDTIRYDWQEAQVRNTSGGTLASIFKVASNARAWTRINFDMTPYAGQTVSLWFNVRGDGYGDLTYMYLDDVSLAGSGPTAPGAPTGVSAAPGDTTAQVSWTAPNNGGSGVTSYTVTPFIGSTPQATTTLSGSPPATSTPVTGLTNGTSYTFTVSATNSVGTGPASAASNAVTPATTPGAPTGLGLSPAKRSMGLSWSAPASNGGSPITKYTVSWSPANGLGATSQDSASTTATIANLVYGTSYTFSVTSWNAIGQSGPSNSVSASPSATVPAAPTGLTASAGNQQVALSWSAPADDGGTAITKYTVSYTDGTTTSTNDVTSGTGTTITGLGNGTTYTFTVTASNAVGTGAASGSAQATPATTPGAPTGLGTSPAKRSMGLSWSAPVSNGGSPITKYTVSWSPANGLGATSQDSVSTTATIANLVYGTSYTFSVTAWNTIGQSGPSTSVSASPSATVPAAPTGLAASAGNQQASLSWSAPADDGGTAITKYTVSYTDGTTTSSKDVSSGTSTTITGLSNGTTYTFTVTATNAVGSGAASGSAQATATGAALIVRNGGFEGSLSPWTLVGSPVPALSSTRVHLGATSALLGNTGTASGPRTDSSLFQSVTLPAGHPSLSFWYWPFTKDRVTYDWEEAQIRNTSGTTLSQIWGRQASNAQAWTSVTVDLTTWAGQTVQLFFNVHDDGFTGDPTYIYLDDVAVN